MPPTIYHIATRQAWDRTGPHYQPDSLAAEGFIHCSTAEQLDDVARRLFKAKSGLVLLEIDQARVEPEVRYEGGGFPHIYGPLNRSAVLTDAEFSRPS